MEFYPQHTQGIGNERLRNAQAWRKPPSLPFTWAPSRPAGLPKVSIYFVPLLAAGRPLPRDYKYHCRRQHNTVAVNAPRGPSGRDVNTNRAAERAQLKHNNMLCVAAPFRAWRQNSLQNTTTPCSLAVGAPEFWHRGRHECSGTAETTGGRWEGCHPLASPGWRKEEENWKEQNES